MGHRARRFAFVVVALTVVLGLSRWLALDAAPSPGDGAGRRIDIGGRSLYLDCRGEGTPTVVLEAGMGGGVHGWRAVHDRLAERTRTCAHDRAGRGQSDPRGRHTLEDAATDLRSLLVAAEEAGPFVLVGHSLGGDYARIFADRHRSEVAGVVLVDAFTPDLETAFIHPLLDTLRAEYEGRLDELRNQVASVEDLDWSASESQLQASSLSGLPISVLSAPRYEPRLDAPTNEAISAARIAGYESLSPGHVTFELAWGAGHMIQDDRPDLVVETVMRLVDGARGPGLGTTSGRSPSRVRVPDGSDPRRRAP